MTAPRTRDSWFRRNPGKALGLVFAAHLLLLEVGVRILVRLGMLRHVEHQTSAHRVFLDDIDEHFGVWHYPDVEVRRKSACYDVTYRSNDYGARDRPRSRKSDAERRVVVLGDSFVEGHGVDSSDRMTDVIESHSGVEHLNFGTSGSFGSIQEWLLYEKLASGFDHSDVFVFLLPANDFVDNDQSQYPAKSRYRPYLRKTQGGYEVYYPTAHEARPGRNRPLTRWERLRHSAYNGVYLLNVLVRVDGGTLERLVSPGPRQARGASYNTFSEADAERLLYTYARIVELAGARRVTVFVVPTQSDFEHYREHGYDFRVVGLLERFARSRQTVSVFDLLPYFVEYADREDLGYEEFFNECDGHWSVLGNRVAAYAVLSHVYGQDPDGRGL